jgi:hypothetical protein
MGGVASWQPPEDRLFSWASLTGLPWDYFDLSKGRITHSLRCPKCTLFFDTRETRPFSCGQAR